MKYMNTNEPERFILDKSIELTKDGNVMVLVQSRAHISQLRHYVHSQGYLEFGHRVDTMEVPFRSYSIFFRASTFLASLKSVPVCSLIILEPVPSVCRKLAIERTRTSYNPEIWRVRGFQQNTKALCS